MKIIQFKSKKAMLAYTIAGVIAAGIGGIATKVLSKREQVSAEQLVTNQRSAQAWTNWVVAHCRNDPIEGKESYVCDNGLHYTLDVRVEDCALSSRKCSGILPLIPPVPQ